MIEGILVLVIVFGVISVTNAWDIRNIVKSLDNHPYHFEERMRDLSDEADVTAYKKILDEIRNPEEIEIGISKFNRLRIDEDNARKIQARASE